MADKDIVCHCEAEYHQAQANGYSEGLLVAKAGYRRRGACGHRAVSGSGCKSEESARFSSLEMDRQECLSYF